MDASHVFGDLDIVPVVTINDPDDAVPLTAALAAAGFGAIEITLRTPAALGAIANVVSAFPELRIGAGSVRSADQMADVRSAGALFAVCPGHTDALLDAARKHAMAFVPGAATAAEMLKLLEAGYRLQKFFPAERLGGLPMIKALSAPLPEVSFFPTGGLDATLAATYLEFEQVCCVGGSWFLDQGLISNKDWSGLHDAARRAREQIHG